MRDFQDYTKEPRAARRRWWVWSLPVLLVAVLAGGAALAFQPAADQAEGPERLKASQTGWIQRMFGGAPLSAEPFNVLVLGVDERPDTEEAGSRTDTIMIVRVIPESGDIKLLSVPRDLLVEVEPGEEDRINAAYNYGGIEQTITALADFSGVALDHFAVVDFKDVINAMGGVKVDVEDEVPPKYKIQDGLQTLDGKQALFYARYRGTSGGDLDRIRHQQQLVAALRSQAFDWNTVRQMPEILKVANRNAQTDLGLQQGISLGKILIRRGPSASMTSQQLKGTPETLDNGNEVLVPNDEANDPILDEFRY